MEFVARRTAVRDARAALEVAQRRMRTADINGRRSLDVDGNPIDPAVLEAAMQSGSQPWLDEPLGGLLQAQVVHDGARTTYAELAMQNPLLEPGLNDPVLLLPVRLEAVYRDHEGSPALLIRVYPDDIHVDAHEPEVTEKERRAGEDYWRAVRASGDDPRARAQAWRVLVSAAGGARAAWVGTVLTPTGAGATPTFPDVEVRPEAWTRAAHTLLLPDRFEFSAYQDGRLVWREAGEAIPDTLPVSIAPQASEAGEEEDERGFDAGSRWLVDFTEACRLGMGLVRPLVDPEERYDLLTVVGIGTQDAATGSARFHDLLRAHAFAKGLSTIPARTPTNNTPESRSAWRSRADQVDPDVADARRAAYDASSGQDAARLARALGVDGAALLAEICDPADEVEDLLQDLHRRQASEFASSRALHPANSESLEIEDLTDPWYVAATDHYTRFVRARGPLPVLRIGRQPYGVLPVSSMDLWRGEREGDVPISTYVRSFHSALAEHVDRALQVGEEGDQDAVLLDLLSRQASPEEVATHDWFFDIPLTSTEGPPPSSVGCIPVEVGLAWLPPPPLDDAVRVVPPFPAKLPDALLAFISARPLAQLFVCFDETIRTMATELEPANPDALRALTTPILETFWQLRATPTLSLFYDRAAAACDWAAATIIATGPESPAQVAERVQRAQPRLRVLASYMRLEEEAIADLPAFECLYRETLEPLSSRIDAWVTSLATARLHVLREDGVPGIRTGAYGWVTDVQRGNPNPSREGFVVTPSLHHATTAGVLRSGWQAHSDKAAFAVDIQSSRARRAQAMVEGVRGGQTMSALLGYQFERALHDAHLDGLVAGFRTTYPLAPLVEPAGAENDAARVSIGARNVVDGQALRLDRSRLDDDQALHSAAGAAVPDPSVLRRFLSELDETFDAVGDLLLAESVHQLVGGNPLRAGLAADAAGRGQDLPADYDVLRTPRSGSAVTHSVGILLPDEIPGGWADGRPLAELEPGLEAWVRHRLGPASAWPVGPGLEDSGWCALELLVLPEEWVRAELAARGTVDEDVLSRLLMVCQRVRAALAGAAPLMPRDVDPAGESPAPGYDVGDVHERIRTWLQRVRSARDDLVAADEPEGQGDAVRRLAGLGLPVGPGDAPGHRARLLTLLEPVDLADPEPPPEGDLDPATADAWVATQLERAAALLSPTLRLVPRLAVPLPGPATPGPEPGEVDDWLRDVVLVRPRVGALDDALVTAEVLAGTDRGEQVVAQPAPGGAAGPWLATAPASETGRGRASLVLQRDAASSAVAGLLVDSWTEVVPRPGGRHGPEEVVGVAFDFDRPGAQAPQSLLVAVPPDPDRGWCMEDLHACVEETLTLARLRTLDLHDVPELRPVLPIFQGF